MKRKSFDLDALCLDWLDRFDGRTGPRVEGKSERARAGISLDCLLSERYSVRFASKVAKMVREGDRTEALRTLHNRIMEDLKHEQTSDAVGGDSAPPSGSVGDDSDDSGGNIAPVPRVAGNEGVEGSPEASEQAATGDPDGEGGAGSRDGSGDKNGTLGLGNGVISQALGWDS